MNNCCWRSPMRNLSVRIFLALLAVAGPVAVGVALVRWVAG